MLHYVANTNIFFPLRLKKKAERYCSMVCCRMIAQTFSAVITIHKPYVELKFVWGGGDQISPYKNVEREFSDV